MGCLWACSPCTTEKKARGQREKDMGWSGCAVSACNWKSKILGRKGRWDQSWKRWKRSPFEMGMGEKDEWSSRESFLWEGDYWRPRSPQQSRRNICWKQGGLGWVKKFEMCGKDLEEWRIQEVIHLGQTKGLLSNTEGLTKNEWHEFLVDTVSMVDCLSQQEACGSLGIEADRIGVWN